MIYKNKIFFENNLNNFIKGIDLNKHVSLIENNNMNNIKYEENYYNDLELLLKNLLISLISFENVKNEQKFIDEINKQNGRIESVITYNLLALSHNIDLFLKKYDINGNDLINFKVDFSELKYILTLNTIKTTYLIKINKNDFNKDTTFLHLFSIFGSYEGIHYLYKNCDIFLKDKYGKTALDILKINENFSKIEFDKIKNILNGSYNNGIYYKEYQLDVLSKMNKNKEKQFLYQYNIENYFDNKLNDLIFKIITMINILNDNNVQQQFLDNIYYYNQIYLINKEKNLSKAELYLLSVNNDLKKYFQSININTKEKVDIKKRKL